jgi:polyisoprenoid-binding protein YceI
MPSHPRASRAFVTLAVVSAIGASSATAQAGQRPSSKPVATGTHWVVDPVHSQVDFRVRHLVGRVRGSFDSSPTSATGPAGPSTSRSTREP